MTRRPETRKKGREGKKNKMTPNEKVLAKACMAYSKAFIIQQVNQI